MEALVPFSDYLFVSMTGQTAVGGAVVYQTAPFFRLGGNSLVGGCLFVHSVLEGGPLRGLISGLDVANQSLLGLGYWAGCNGMA